MSNLKTYRVAKVVRQKKAKLWIEDKILPLLKPEVD